jgi:acetyltransferase-like isoleucine patch superfamily enzyme
LTHTDEWYRNWKFPTIEEGKPTKYGWVVLHLDGFKMGRHTDIGYGCVIQAEAKVTIEDDVELGAGVKIYSVSTIDGKRGFVLLEKGCKIGANSVILPGVKVGAGAVVGALSLVNEDIPPGAVAYGIPARVKR